MKIATQVGGFVTTPAELMVITDDKRKRTMMMSVPEPGHEGEFDEVIDDFDEDDFDDDFDDDFEEEIEEDEFGDLDEFGNVEEREREKARREKEREKERDREKAAKAKAKAKNKENN